MSRHRLPSVPQRRLPEDRSALDPDLKKAAELHQAGRFAEAEAAYLAALARNPKSIALLANLGALYRTTRRIRDAEACYKRALALQPNAVLVLGNYANLLKATNREEMAIELLDRAVRLEPRNAQHLANRALSKIGLGRFQDGLQDADAALTLDGRNSEAHCAAGQAHAQMGHPERAEQHFRLALESEPTTPVYVTNLANALVARGDFPGALSLCRSAIARMPENVDLLARCCDVLQTIDAGEDAIAAGRRAVALEPGNPLCHWYLALALLKSGNLGEGGDEYEWRWRMPDFPSPSRRFAMPEWPGGDPRGKRLYLWGEQGVGDETLHLSMVPDLVDAGAQVYVEVDPRLEPLIARGMPGVTLVRRSAERPFPTVGRVDVDFQLPLASLIRHFRRDFTNLAPAHPYLAPDPARVSALRARYRALGPGPVIGLGWSSKNPKIGSMKSLRLDDLEPLLRARPATYVSMQYGDVEEELEKFYVRTGIRIHRDSEIDAMHDLDGYAAQALALDLMISTSNSGVHVAAAAGAAVWLVLPSPQGTLWYWFSDGDKAPWYANVRIFRGRGMASWPQLQARIASELLTLS